MSQEIRIALIGLGNVGRSFLKIIESKQDRLRQQYGLSLRLVCVADSSGVAVDPAGFDPGATRLAKESGVSVRRMGGYRPSVTPAEVIAGGLTCDLVLEASPVNLQTGEPGLSVVRAALGRGIGVVLANKGPLVLAFAELQRLAREHGAGLAYSATVCGALPVVNVGRRDLIAADITSLRGIFNSTSNFILAEMAAGRPYDAALAEAQVRGLAETDPSLDVEGWDTANKLVIIANSFLGMPATLADVTVQGITGLAAADLQAAQTNGRAVKLLASATRGADGVYTLSVAPTELDGDEFLARCHGWEMGIELHSDLYGSMYFKDLEGDPLPTAAAMLRDAVNLFA